jgi:hypothetical protein
VRGEPGVAVDVRRGAAAVGDLVGGPDLVVAVVGRAAVTFATLG